MAKKGTKATRKFAASGQLTKKIQARRKHQQIQRKVHKSKGVSKRPEREDESRKVKNPTAKNAYVISPLEPPSYAHAMYPVSKACQ
jgi:hypothetical protein